MDLSTFWNNFEVIAEAPSGVQRLRELILDLAVRGKLVPQDLTDEPAAKALENMDLEKKQLLEGKRRKKKSTQQQEYEISFPLPYQWSQVELDRLCIFIDYRGKTPKKVECGVRLITAKNVRDGFIKQDPEEFIEEETYHNWMTRGFPKRGDVLFTTEAPMGKAAVVDLQERFALAQRIINLQPLSHLNGHFLMWLILSPWFQRELQEYATGMTATGIKASKLKQMQIPLPPLAEQKRIVAKVDELMALCDRYEVLKCDRNTLRTKMRASAIDALMNAETDEALNIAWEFIRDNWECLSQHPEEVQSIRKIVLLLGVQGKLDTHNRADRSANELLSEIALEQEALVKAGQLKKDKLLDTHPPSLGHLPENWCWCFLHDLKTFGPRNGYSPKAVNYPTSTRSITLTATTSGNFDGRFFKYIDQVIDENSYLWLQPGDLLIQRSNTLAYVGTAAIYDDEPGKYIFPDLIMRLRLSDKVDVRYVHRVLQSELGKSHFQTNASGTSGTMPKVNQKVVHSTPIPLPPFAEQKRIVAKVDQLMTLCDTLEAHLHETQEKATALAAAVVGQLEV